MNILLTRLFIVPGLVVATLAFQSNALAQIPVSNQQEHQDYRHGIEQYQQGHYTLAIQSLKAYLQQESLPVLAPEAPHNLQQRTATYYLALSQLKVNQPGSEALMVDLISRTTDPAQKQRAAFALAQHYFQKNELNQAIHYYEVAGVANLSNAEIADAKFELAYSYFNEHRFDMAMPLFAAIKEMPDHKYYIAGNYYYGLLAYNDKNYEQALKSFERINQEPAYKDIIPYYEAEIHYFLGNNDKVLEISKAYLGKNDSVLFYNKEMQLLTGQTLFEQKEFAKALPYFEYYYAHADKIRKEELYELAFTYYRLEKWQQAIEKFKPLSNTQDSLGQTSMYLLGDCYLKTGDKKGAMNAFGICAQMDFNPSQKEAATFLNAKLAYELGHDGLATATLYDYVRTYPNATFNPEARTLLSSLLAKSNNYSKAFEVLSDMAIKDNNTWSIYQQVAVGYAMQLMQEKNNNTADSVLNLSLQQPSNKDFEAIAYFWKGEIAYREKRYQQAVQYSRSFLSLAKGNESRIKDINKQATVQHAQLTIGYAQLANEDYNEAGEAFAAAGNPTNDEGQGMGAEATLRAADASFMLKEFSKADRLYSEAIASGVTNADYARFQKSLIAGLQNNHQEKTRLLYEIISKQPASAYRDEAQYELAVTQLETGARTEVITLLKQLAIQTTDNHNLKSKALLKLAYAYQETDQEEAAISIYRQYLTEYPASTERATAIDALRNLYIATGQPEQYAKIAQELELPDADENGLEQTFYAAAETEFTAGNWEKAVTAFTKYINQFPHGTQLTKAHFYRAESYAKLNKQDQALADYTIVTGAGWSDFTADAAAKAAQLAMNGGNFEAAQQHYALMRDEAMDNAQLHTAYAGLMRAAFELGNHQEATGYADTLLSLGGLSDRTTAEAQLYKAKVLQAEKNSDQAMAIYEALDKKNIGTFSAEARYRIAELLLAKRELKEAERRASYAAQHAGGSEYWVVKSYILIGQVLKEQKDYFNAKATLQSIIQNAKDATLKTEAKQLLEEVKTLERSGSKLSEE